MNPADPDIISALRIDMAALSRDMAHVQREISEIRAVFSRLVWFLVIGLMGAVLRFAMEGGFNA